MVLLIHLLALHIISSELKSSLYSIFKNTHYKLIILVLKKHFKQIFQNLVVRMTHTINEAVIIVIGRCRRLQARFVALAIAMFIKILALTEHRRVILTTKWFSDRVSLRQLRLSVRRFKESHYRARISARNLLLGRRVGNLLLMNLSTGRGRWIIDSVIARTAFENVQPGGSIVRLEHSTRVLSPIQVCAHITSRDWNS